MAEKVAPVGPAGMLTFASKTNRAHLSRLAKAGRAQRLAAGIYAVDAALSPIEIARHHRFAVIEHVWPGAVLCGKTALSGGEPVDGALHVAHPNPPRAAPLGLPGLRIHVQIGPAPLPGDMPFHGLWMSGVARMLVENVHLHGRPVRAQAGTAAVEDRIDELARTGGAGRIRTTLGQLDVIAGSFSSPAVTAVRVRLAAVLGTLTDVAPTSSRLRARLAGEPYDAHRLAMLRRLVEALSDRAPTPRPSVGGQSRHNWLPFFEAYFSNFIEGTQFGVEEARAIAVEGVQSPTRPADAHDVAATYRLANDPADVAHVPRSGEALVDLLARRHGVLMAARPDKRPGQLKDVPNFAGGYRFVDPELVVGTLHQGFAVMRELIDPFARAVAIMVLVTECHPFADGNGRVARLTASAELTAGGQVRFVIPTVYRTNYLVALTGLSGGAGRGESLISVLDFAQKWTAAIDWSTFERSHDQMEQTHAYLDAGVAENSGRRLRLPN